jgi:hypothetical protein
MKNSSHICVSKIIKTVNKMLVQSTHTTKNYFGPNVDLRIGGAFCSVS